MHDLSDTAVRKLTAEVLARPEFAAPAPKLPFWMEWLHKLAQWLEKIQLLHDSSPMLYWLLVVIVVMVTIGLIAHITWSLRTAMSAPDAKGPDIAAVRSAPDLAGEARALAASGNYLEAGHRLMIASFQRLADRSVIELRPDRSNRWIRGAVRKSSLPGRLAEDLDTLVVNTERRWFGGRENDRDLYSRWLSVFEQLAVELK